MNYEIYPVHIRALISLYQTDTDKCTHILLMHHFTNIIGKCKLHLKCDGTSAETRFRLSAKRSSPFKSAGASVQSTTGSRGVRISGSNAGYTVFRGSVKSTGYPLHSPVSPSLPLPCVAVCHHISTGLYYTFWVYSRRYPACNAHAPYCHLACPDLGYFSTYVISGIAFEVGWGGRVAVCHHISIGLLTCFDP
jgi:hypothetical protein